VKEGEGREHVKEEGRKEGWKEGERRMGIGETRGEGGFT